MGTVRALFMDKRRGACGLGFFNTPPKIHDLLLLISPFSPHITLFMHISSINNPTSYGKREFIMSYFSIHIILLNAVSQSFLPATQSELLWAVVGLKMIPWQQSWLIVYAG